MIIINSECLAKLARHNGFADLAKIIEEKNVDSIGISGCLLSQESRTIFSENLFGHLMVFKEIMAKHLEQQ